MTEDDVMPTPDREAGVLLLTSEIVQCYISQASIPTNHALDLIPALVRSVRLALAGETSADPVSAAPEIEKPTAAAIKKSITPDAIISFIDGKSYKTMRRHLGTHGLTPDQYRQQFGLPADYPIVAANYSAQRSALAKSIGLGAPGGQAKRKAA